MKNLCFHFPGYSGLARLHRLLFVAHHCPLLRVEALRLGVHHVMATYNTGLYLTMHKKLVEAATGPSEASASSSSNLPGTKFNSIFSWANYESSLIGPVHCDLFFS